MGTGLGIRHLDCPSVHSVTGFQPRWFGRPWVGAEPLRGRPRGLHIIILELMAHKYCQVVQRPEGYGFIQPKMALG
jgi:hypothetical protein